MDALLNDLRYALRTLRKSPAFTAVAVLTLALGIGANSAIFSIVRAVLLRPLPYGEPERVTMLWQTAGAEKGGTTWLSAPEVLAYRNEARSFSDFAGYMETSASLTGGDEPERVSAAALTASGFGVLQVGALLGRAFREEEDAPGADAVVVLGHGLWQRRFGGDPGVIGSEIRVDGRVRTVIGVMPPSFRLPLDYRRERPTELWIPLALDPNNLGGWGNRSLLGFGRLRPGVTPEQATAEIDRLHRSWIEQGLLQSDDRGLGRSAVPVAELVFGDVRTALLILLGTVGFVLLIACANVANLLLARADARRREVAIRAALGAARRRIVTQLLTESVVLALIGGALGVALAFLGLELLIALDPASIPRVEEAGLDAGVLGFTAGLALVTGLLFGLAPALRLSEVQLVGALREGSRGATGGRNRQLVRQTLVVAELALSVVLLIGAGLLIRSFVELQRIELGFEPQNLLTMQLALPQAEYPEARDVTGFYRQLVEQVEALPAVQSAAAVRVLPLTGTIGDWSITLEGRPAGPGENPNGDWQVVTPGYFEAMGLRLLRGRFLSDADREDAPMVVVVNQTMAEHYWPGGDALGERFHLGTRDQPWLTIVGIVRNVRHNAVVEEPRAEMYLPHAQLPREVGFAPRTMTLVVRTSAPPLALVDRAREAIRALDPNLPVTEVRSMEQVVSAALAQPRFTTLLLGVFAGLALILAAVGIYGVIAFGVAQRTREIGIRVALGAARRSILGMVVRQGMLLTLAGIALGVLAALLLTRLLASLLYGVTALDAPTFLIVPLILGTVALLASYLPAWRATRVDPIIALRAD